MAETGNIEDAAKAISSDIFKWLKWETCALRDVNWDCVTNHHKKKTHPSDVVFFYNDPYLGKKIYLNTDLKSYKKSTIKIGRISKALSSLALSVECANVSSDWQEKFLINTTEPWIAKGLLFIYNHDNEYDKDFSDLIAQINFTKIEIPKSVELAMFDPSRIRNLFNTVTDMKLFAVDHELKRDDFTFFYPDLVMSRRHGEEWNQPASIEALTAPWLIIKHQASKDIQEGYLIYYHMPGETVEEFIYLIDALSHYQMLLSTKSITVRFTTPSDLAGNNFNKAKIEYSRLWGDDQARQVQLERINAGKINKVAPNYCPYEIGMRDND